MVHRRRTALILLLTLCAWALPLFAQEPALPSVDPDNWLLAFTDVETTGLVPGYHEMIDIGLIYTDLDGHPIDSLFVRMMPPHPERTSPGAVRVNGFSVQRWDSLDAVSDSAAVARIVAFHDSVANGCHVLLVAFNSHFDTAFIDHLFRSQNRTWRDLYYYYVLDIPSMAWSLGLRDLTGSSLAARLGVPDEPHDPRLHTGITGTALNARIYRALLTRSHNAGL